MRAILAGRMENNSDSVAQGRSLIDLQPASLNWPLRVYVLVVEALAAALATEIRAEQAAKARNAVSTNEGRKAHNE